MPSPRHMTRSWTFSSKATKSCTAISGDSRHPRKPRISASRCSSNSLMNQPIASNGKDALLRTARALLQSRYQPLLRVQKALRSIRDGTRWNSAQLQNSHEHPQPMTTRRLRALERALIQLPSDQCQSIRLVIAEGLTTEEASVKMGVKSSLVEAWASSGLQRLNERIFNHVEHAH